MRIGVFGGAFDPPHAAHAALAGAARARLDLDRVVWLPTATPPHKRAPVAPFAHRVAMTRALTAGDATAEVSELEAALPSPSYTVHTLAALRARFGEGHQWHLIVGADNWAGFERWHEPEAVLAAASLAVYPRAGFPVTNLPAGATLLDFPEMPEQSTDFRAWLARDRAAALAALPAEVGAYISAHGLYTDAAHAPGSTGPDHASARAESDDEISRAGWNGEPA